MKDNYAKFVDLGKENRRKLHTFQTTREGGWKCCSIIDCIHDLEIFDKKNVSSIIVYPYDGFFQKTVSEIRQRYHIRCTVYSDDEFSGYYAETHRFGQAKVNVDEAMERELSFQLRGDGSLKIVNKTGHIKWSEILLAVGVYQKIVFGY